ncbi:MAG: hypothetical protein EOP11_04665 [Proteobacteria bacterium]|nr:MAG: hypothetical protein EOP11_04665 [Pseudomonadota bacterium]
MLRSSNLLVLDEPTNDLDIPTLNVLEDVLQDFPGAVILVTHDRYFLDRVANEIIAIGSEVNRFSEVSQWEEWRRKPAAAKGKASGKGGKEPKEARAELSTPTPAPAKGRKLSYKEQRELDGMEAAIGKLDAKMKELEGESAKFASQASKLLEITQALAATQKEIDQLYKRWAELEA